MKKKKQYLFDRGEFRDLVNTPLYKNADKLLSVELRRSHILWLEHIVGCDDPEKSRLSIDSWLEESYKEMDIHKYFIYFLCARKKVRFDPGTRPMISNVLKDVEFHLEVGEEKKKCFFTVKQSKIVGKNGELPEMEVEGKRIVFHYPHLKKPLEWTVHDFLRLWNINIGTASEVHYVGMTQDPRSRFLDSRHAGLMDMLYRVSNTDNDFFVYCNTFNVYLHTFGSSSPVQFNVANPMVGEIGVKDEGSLLEKAFILYFDPKNQFRNRKNELAELRNNLARMGRENNLRCMTAYYEHEQPTDYYVFQSSAVPPKAGHEFSLRLEEGGVSLSRDADTRKIAMDALSGPKALHVFLPE